MNATELAAKSYRELWGAVSFQIQAGAQRPHKAAGRPVGSPSKARAALKDEMRRNPQWNDKEIYEVAVKRGIWPDDGKYADEPERNKARVRRLKES